VTPHVTLHFLRKGERLSAFQKNGEAPKIGLRHNMRLTGLEPATLCLEAPKNIILYNFFLYFFISFENL
jgi:hypothetical protein